MSEGMKNQIRAHFHSMGTKITFWGTLEKRKANLFQEGYLPFVIFLHFLSSLF
jgi:hypothetical protein